MALNSKKAKNLLTMTYELFVTLYAVQLIRTQQGLPATIFTIALSESITCALMLSEDQDMPTGIKKVLFTNLVVSPMIAAISLFHLCYHSDDAVIVGGLLITGILKLLRLVLTEIRICF